MTCGLNHVTYEVTYHIQGNQFSSFSFHDTVVATAETTNPDSTMQYILRSLLPFTEYSVKVRVVGYVDTGNGMYVIDNGLLSRTLLVASNYSATIYFKTLRSGEWNKINIIIIILVSLFKESRISVIPNYCNYNNIINAPIVVVRC